jgi:hypothetical protein
MPKSIEDILVRIHDDPDHDEHTKFGRMVREVDAHLAPFGHYTATERVRIGTAFRDKNLTRFESSSVQHRAAAVGNGAAQVPVSLRSARGRRSSDTAAHRKR